MFQHYMHLTGVPAFRSSRDGVVYLDELAARDLSRHTYLGTEVRVVCPVITVSEPPPGTVRFEQPGFEFVPLPHAKRVLGYVFSGRWLRAMWIMWRQLGWADLAFLGFVEHPIPYGWTAVPSAAMRKVPWYSFFESSPWRVPSGVAATWRRRVRAAVTEPINRVLIRRAAFAFISHAEYLDFLRPGCPYFVSPACWFLHDEMATKAEIETVRGKAAQRPPHLMYVGRLDPAKGIDVLLEALAIVDDEIARGRFQAGFEFTVVGAGQLRAHVLRAAGEMHHVKLVVLEPVPYGRDFFRLLRSADALVVPSLGDEQPRNVFDAYSQGVPVLAFDTPGLRSIVSDQVNGRLVATGDVAGLAAAIGELLVPGSRTHWRTFGDAGYELALANDHDAMHAKRAAFVAGLYQ